MQVLELRHQLQVQGVQPPERSNQEPAFALPEGEQTRAVRGSWDQCHVASLVVSFSSYKSRFPRQIPEAQADPYHQSPET